MATPHLHHNVFDGVRIGIDIECPTISLSQEDKVKSTERSKTASSFVDTGGRRGIFAALSRWLGSRSEEHEENAAQLALKHALNGSDSKILATKLKIGPKNTFEGITQDGIRLHTEHTADNASGRTHQGATQSTSPAVATSPAPSPRANVMWVNCIVIMFWCMPSDLSAVAVGDLMKSRICSFLKIYSGGVMPVLPQ